MREELARLALRTPLLRVAEAADVDRTFLVRLGEVGRGVEDALGGKYDVPWL